MTAMVVVSTLTWLPLGIAPLALTMARTGADEGGDGGGTKGWLLLLVTIIAQSSVVSAPLMHVAGGRNLRRSAVAFFLCQRQNKVGTHWSSYGGDGFRCFTDSGFSTSRSLKPQAYWPTEQNSLIKPVCKQRGLL